MTVDGSCARPTPRQSPTVAGSIVRNSFAAASTRAFNASIAGAMFRRGERLALAPSGGELCVVQCITARVGEQPVDDTGDVSHVKRH